MNQRIRSPRPDSVEPARRAPVPVSVSAPPSLRAMRPGDVAQVQATAGNRAARGAVQRQMEVGAANDPHEHEADAVAREIVNGSAQRQPEEEELQASHIGRASLEEEEPLQGKHIERAALEEEELLQGKHIERASLEEEEPLQGKHIERAALEEEELQMKSLQRDAAPEVGMAGGAASAETSSTVESARGGGRPLDKGVRSEMEGAFGADFSGVRVHEGAEAADLNDRISARAFTTGSDIFIGREGLNPGSRGGKELLAHELTHVVQQGAAGRKPRRES